MKKVPHKLCILTKLHTRCFKNYILDINKIHSFYYDTYILGYLKSKRRESMFLKASQFVSLYRNISKCTFSLLGLVTNTSKIITWNFCLYNYQIITLDTKLNILYKIRIAQWNMRYFIQINCFAYFNYLIVLYQERRNYKFLRATFGTRMNNVERPWLVFKIKM